MIPIEELNKSIDRYPDLIWKEKTRTDNIAASLGDRTDRKMTMIFANPRSGSTLLLRLLNLACMTRCVGDRRLEFYQAACSMWHNRKSESIKFQSSLIDGSFPDEFCGYGDDSHLDREYLRLIKTILFTTAWGHAFMKSTIPGFRNDVIADMYDIIDEFTYNHDFTLVILQRPAEEVAESFITSPGGPLFKKEEKRQEIIDAVHYQNEQFKIITDFDTVFITYEELCKDPVSCLIKCNPVYSPHQGMVDKVMSKKIR